MRYRILTVDIDASRVPACRAYLSMGRWVPLTFSRFMRARRALARQGLA